MNLNEQIQQVELSLEEAQRLAEVGEALVRLEQNKDFQRIIFQGYFNDEARRLAFLSADQVLDEGSHRCTLHSIRAIGELRGYLVRIRQEAEQAAKEIRDHRETLEELRHEDAQGE